MSEREQQAERLREVLERVLARDARIRAIDALPGISHRSFRVDTDHGAFVVKLREAGAAHVLSVADEHRVYERAAAAGVAPGAVGFDADAGAIVTRFVEGAVPLSAAQAREPRVIGELARLLDALHGVRADGVAAFTAEAHARRYVEAVERAGGLDAADRALADELVALGAEVDALSNDRVLCHTDLVASNVLVARRPWLIDYEYAAVADPVLDLASLAAMNRYDAGQCEALLDAYARVAQRAWARAEFAKVMRLMALMAYFWAGAEAGRTGPRAELDEFLRRDELLERRNEQ